MSKRTKTTFRFASEAEERAFWEGQDSTAYVDWLTAKRAVLPNLKPTAETIPNARHVIEREDMIRLSASDWSWLLDLMENPPKPNAKLKAAMKRHQTARQDAAGTVLKWKP